jgi:hypothetical protein
MAMLAVVGMASPIIQEKELTQNGTQHRNTRLGKRI